MFSRDQKSQALATLLDARMQHRKWVAEVLNNENPQVMEDHTQCEFGKWMIAVREVLDDLEEFQDLDVPHRELHMVYKILKSNPDHAILREEIQLLSNKLIGRIDSLEKCLKELD